MVKMALRMIEITISEGRREALENFLTSRDELLDVRVQKIIETWKHPEKKLWLGSKDSYSEGQFLVKVLAFAESSEPLLDALQENFSNDNAFRINIIPIEASLPKREKPADSSTKEAKEIEAKKEGDRLSREELYADIEESARLTKVYGVLVLLSSVVASIGLLNNNISIIIGAMVIAPLLGPNVALSLAITLGDIRLAKSALKTIAAGFIAALVPSIAIGMLFHVDPNIPELLSRTRVGFEEVILALVSGCAGTLAFTSGVPATLVGVAVAVALLPPLATFGLLIGSGNHLLSIGALLLFLVNIISINLAGVVTFLAQGISPKTWFEAKIAKKSTITSIIILTMLLAILLILIFIINLKS
jgi:uncharacterized hydrophobic protein (TIGR00341 family)